MLKPLPEELRKQIRALEDEMSQHLQASDPDIAENIAKIRQLDDELDKLIPSTIRLIHKGLDNGSITTSEAELAYTTYTDFITRYPDYHPILPREKRENPEYLWSEAEEEMWRVVQPILDKVQKPSRCDHPTPDV